MSEKTDKKEIWLIKTVTTHCLCGYRHKRKDTNQIICTIFGFTTDCNYENCPLKIIKGENE